MNSSKTVADNLEAIEGLGPKARIWLDETFEVRTFAALAGLSLKELVNQIKADKKTTWLPQAKDWPKEAAKKAAEMIAKTEAMQPAPASGVESPSPKPNNPEGGKDGWDTLALYFVEFQSRQVPEKPVERRTKVVFEDPGDRVVDALPGFEQNRICQWIFDHFDGVLRAIPLTETLPDTEITTQETGPPAISVSQLRLFQPAGAGSPLFSYSSKRPRLSTVTADQPFVLEATLEGIRPQISANGRITVNVQFFVKNWDTKSHTNLGNVKLEAIKYQLNYSALLPETSLPRGKYQLQVLVLAHPKPVVLGSVEIPLLSVW